jgi:hypothetical protein
MLHTVPNFSDTGYQVHLSALGAMATNRILVLRWTGSAYESLDGFLGLIARAFGELGHEVTFFSVEGSEWTRSLAGLLETERFDFALTMSGIGIGAIVPGKGLIWEVAKVPLFNWSCDHPCYFPPRHAARSRFILHGYVFPDHAQYNIRYLNPNGMAFAVHIGMPPRHIFHGAPLPVSARNGRIIFTKSGKDSNAIAAEWQDRLPPLREILLAAAEELLHQGTAAFVPVLQRIAAPHGLLLAAGGELMLSLIRELDDYIRFRRGDMVVRALLDHPVDVFGSGWDHIPWDHARSARFHGPLPWHSAAVERLPSYLGALSINPLVEQSVHDRVFFALAAGVTPLTDDNSFARTRMPALRPYCFDFTPERIIAAADALLSDPAEALARTEAACQALAPDVTMRRAAEQIVQFAGLCGANLRWGA